MGRQAIAIIVGAIVLLASLSLCIIPMVANNDDGGSHYSSLGNSYGGSSSSGGGSSSSSSSSSGGTFDFDSSTTESSSSGSSSSVAAASDLLTGVKYESKNQTAYIAGSTSLPIVTIVGDTYARLIPDANGIKNYSTYVTWLNSLSDSNLNGDTDFGCSAFMTEDGKYVGRNLDYSSGFKIPIVVKCIPNSGYASIGLTSKAMFYSNSLSLSGMATSKVLTVPMFVLDGMNEKGLTCCSLDVCYDNGSACNGTESGKSIYSFAMIRYLLDNAATVAEAKEIITKIGFTSVHLTDESIHLFVTDAQGNHTIVECVNGKLCFVDDSNCVTNHYMSAKGKALNCKLWDDTVSRLTAMQDRMGKDSYTMADCRDILEAAQGNDGWDTIYSIVYDVEKLTLNVWYNEKYTVDAVIYDVNDLVAIRTSDELQTEIETDDDEEESDE